MPVLMAALSTQIAFQKAPYIVAAFALTHKPTPLYTLIDEKGLLNVDIIFVSIGLP